MALLAVATGVSLLAGPASAKKCKDDAVLVGTVCIDQYEASVWEIPSANAALIKSVQKSKIASAADMSGATQRGVASDDYSTVCPDNGNGCKDDYAVSIPGVKPSAYLTWLQAAAACRNAGKRLATNAEWQLAALGTPDPGTDNGTTDCNISTAGAVLNTGSRSACVSDVGAFDMSGNLSEWIADWGAFATGCSTWASPMFGNDIACASSDGTSTDEPGAYSRGGSAFDLTGAGVFYIRGNNFMEDSFDFLGFRCVREL
jgi:hypothetical protein